MRYDDPAHLARWRETGYYPAIHNPIFHAAAEYLAPDDVVLDLCSSTGLLGRRVVHGLGNKVVALDANPRSIEAGSAAGVYDGISVLVMRLEYNTLPAFVAWARDHEVTAVLARRCLMELSHALDLRDLGAAFDLVGVTTVILEGHHRGKDPMLPADVQARSLGLELPQVAARGNVRVLQRLYSNSSV